MWMVYVAIFVAIMLVIMIIRYFADTKSLKKIGSSIYEINSPSNTDFTMNMIRGIVTVALLVYFCYTRSTETAPWMIILFCAVLDWIAAGFFYSAFAAVKFSSRSGVYENGAVTPNGVCLYKDVKYFSVSKVPTKRGNGKERAVIFYAKYDILSKGKYLQTSDREAMRIQKLLEKRISFKTFKPLFGGKKNKN